MLRFSALLLVALLCAMHAPAPDPRVLAAINAAAVTLPPGTQPATQYPDGEYVCPMDPDVRSPNPGNCPRCGMKLVEGIMNLTEYPLHLTADPRPIKPGENTLLNFDIVDPRTLKPVREFEVVHEKLFHLFVVSQDMKFFLHTHPERQGDEDFHLTMKFPKPGMYRVLSDFYPHGGTPQLLTRTVMVPGEGFKLQQAVLHEDTGRQNTENASVELVLDPPRPIEGQKTTLYFRITPDDGIEPYLGSMAHLLAASSDLIDMIHSHPFQSTDARGNAWKQMQFNLTLPRAGVHRVWIQFQRKGVVNTAAFNVPVAEAR